MFVCIVESVFRNIVLSRRQLLKEETDGDSVGTCNNQPRLFEHEMAQVKGYETDFQACRSKP
jgi:hypothetical protein